MNAGSVLGQRSLTSEGAPLPVAGWQVAGLRWPSTSEGAPLAAPGNSPRCAEESSQVVAKYAPPTRNSQLVTRNLQLATSCRKRRAVRTLGIATNLLDSKF
jgi:hypothetical protein